MSGNREKVAVIGFGVTGKSVAKFLLSKDVDVHVFDSKKRDSFDPVELQKFLDVTFHFETNDFDPTEYAYLVTSPGASLEISPIKKALALGVPVHNDLTLFIEAWRKIGKIVGVTGSNGKTTTVSLMYEALKKITPTILAGNIGNSPLDLLDIGYPKGVVAVLEISSYQLELFRPEHYLDVCVVTNLSSNHLDRYNGSMLEYGAAKLRGIDKKKTKTIVCADDPGTQKYLLNQIKCDQVFVVSFEIATDQIILPGIYIDRNNALIFKSNPKLDCDVIFDKIENRKLIGIHNLYNISFILLTIKLLDLEVNNSVINIIRSFDSLEHRLEKVTEKNGVVYVNDSKSTSPDSIRVALEALGNNKNIILIAGGDDKDMSFDYLAEFFSEKVKNLIIIPGEISKKLIKAAKASENVPINETNNLAEATTFAAKIAEVGDVVLLSPGSYSKNYFKDYKDRGNKFKEFVRAL